MRPDPPPVEGFAFGDRSLIPPPAEAPGGDEVVSERTATSRTFETDIPGVFVTESSLARIHYRQGGEWHPIDPTLAADGDGGFENTADSMSITVAGDAAEGTVAAVELADGSSVGFGLDGAEPSEAAVDGGTAVFDDVQPGVDLELVSTPTGLKETLILGSPAAPDTFTFPLEVDGLAASVDESGAVVFRDDENRVRMTIPPGWMEDSSADPDTGLAAVSTGVTYTLSPDGTVLVVSVDRGWLDDPARVYPVRVDPTLEPVYAHIQSEADDTYVVDTSAGDRSTQYVLKAGFDGTSVHRSFLHFDLSSLEGMNVIGADLAVVQNGSGSCTATPLDVYEVTEDWEGSSTTTWSGQPDTAEDPTATITSGLGHDGTCPAGFATTDLTRTAQRWTGDPTSNFGLSLRAQNEADTAQFKQVGSRESYVPPTVNVLWSDPWQEDRPADPTALAPTEVVDTFDPTYSASYYDPEDDDGMVVFFGYLPDSGAFAGAATSDEVESGEIATATGYLPLDFPVAWRAMAVDLTNEVPSALSAPVPLVHPSIHLSEPFDGDEIAGLYSLAAQIDPSITDATGVVFNLDGQPLETVSSAPFELTVPSNEITDGNHTITAEIVGGDADGRTSDPVEVTIDNSEEGPPPEAYSEAALVQPPRLRRTLGATDDAGSPLGTAPEWAGIGDCGYSEPLPDGQILWLLCDALGIEPYGRSAVAGIASSTAPTAPEWLDEQFVPVDPGLSCPDFDVPGDGDPEPVEDRPVSWMTGVTSVPIPTSNPAEPDTVVAVFFMSACARRVMIGDTTHPEWDPGTAGVALWTHEFGEDDLEPAQVLEYDTWVGRWGSGQINVLHGDGVVYSDQSGTGHIYAYACMTQRLNTVIPAYGRCTVAKAPATPSTVADLGDRSSWKYWNGSGWTACGGGCDELSELREAESHQLAMTIPTRERNPFPPAVCPDGSSPPCPSPHHVPQHFQVVYSDQLGAFVAANQRFAFDQDGTQTLRARLAARPWGPWSQPVNVSIDCRVPAGQLTCYQIGAHPELTPVDGNSTIFHYYDRFATAQPVPPQTQVFPQAQSISFIEVPLCANDTGRDEGPTAGVDYVVGRCFLTDPGTTTAWDSDTIGRRETAAMLWRLRGFRNRAVDSSVTSVPGPYQESVRAFLDVAGFAAVWNDADEFVPDTPTTRGELIELLWRFAGQPAVASIPTADKPSDWSSIDPALKPPLRWAYTEDVTCAGLGAVGPFDPDLDARRAVAAKWVRRIQADVHCTGTENE